MKDYTKLTQNSPKKNKLSQSVQQHKYNVTNLVWPYMLNTE